ncbi:MAG: hypothetical protein HC819_03155 [Cyclobacteriaceae bacterium]|nr:hypothetical protein [Cyclobacteriaceae bacterium]
MMKNVLIVFMAIFVAYACASTKSVSDMSVGTWDYLIKNTPEGDLTGNFVISKDGDSYSGAINAAQGSIPMQNVVVENGNMTSNFDYMGYTVNMSGKFEGTSFSGKVSVDYNDFPVSATKR